MYSNDCMFQGTQKICFPIPGLEIPRLEKLNQKGRRKRGKEEEREKRFKVKSEKKVRKFHTLTARIKVSP